MYRMEFSCREQTVLSPLPEKDLLPDITKSLERLEKQILDLASRNNSQPLDLRGSYHDHKSYHGHGWRLSHQESTDYETTLPLP